MSFVADELVKWREDPPWYDRIDMDGLSTDMNPYRQVFSMTALDDGGWLKSYDVILIADLLETYDKDAAREFMLKLYPKASGTIIVATPTDIVSEDIFKDDGVDVAYAVEYGIPKDICLVRILHKERENENQ